MHMERAAAVLRAWNNDFTTVPLQHANRGFVEPGEGDVGDAPSEKCHAIAAFADSWKRLADFGIEEWDFRTGGERFHISQVAKELENSSCTRETLHTGSLVKI